MSEIKGDGGGGYLPFEFWGVRLRSQSTEKNNQRVKKEPDSPSAARRGTAEGTGGGNPPGNSSPDPARRAFRFGRRKSDDDKKKEKIDKQEKEDREQDKDRHNKDTEGEEKAGDKRRSSDTDKDKDRERRSEKKDREREEAGKDKAQKRDREARDRDKRKESQRQKEKAKRNSRDHEKSKDTEGDERRSKDRRLVSALSSNALTSYKNYIKDDTKDAKKRPDHIRNVSGEPFPQAKSQAGKPGTSDVEKWLSLEKTKTKRDSSSTDGSSSPPSSPTRKSAGKYHASRSKDQVARPTKANSHHSGLNRSQQMPTKGKGHLPTTASSPRQAPKTMRPLPPPPVNDKRSSNNGSTASTKAASSSTAPPATAKNPAKVIKRQNSDTELKAAAHTTRPPLQRGRSMSDRLGNNNLLPGKQKSLPGSPRQDKTSPRVAKKASDGEQKQPPAKAESVQSPRRRILPSLDDLPFVTRNRSPKKSPQTPEKRSPKPSTDHKTPVAPPSPSKNYEKRCSEQKEKKKKLKKALKEEKQKISSLNDKLAEASMAELDRVKQQQDVDWLLDHLKAMAEGSTLADKSFKYKSERMLQLLGKLSVEMTNIKEGRPDSELLAKQKEKEEREQKEKEERERKQKEDEAKEKKEPEHSAEKEKETIGKEKKTKDKEEWENNTNELKFVTNPLLAMIDTEHRRGTWGLYEQMRLGAQISMKEMGIAQENILNVSGGPELSEDDSETGVKGKEEENGSKDDLPEDGEEEYEADDQALSEIDKRFMGILPKARGLALINRKPKAHTHSTGNPTPSPPRSPLFYNNFLWKNKGVQKVKERPRSPTLDAKPPIFHSDSIVASKSAPLDRKYGTVVPKKRRGGTTLASLSDRLGIFLDAKPDQYQVIGQQLLDGRFFGVSLENLLDEDHTIPPTVENLISFLEQSAIHAEDLFFKEVHPDQVVELQKLLETTEGNAELEAFGLYVVGEVLRLFFVLLPDPLIKPELTEALLNSADVQARNFRLCTCHSIVFSLVESHRILLQRLLLFFWTLCKSTEQNKLSPTKIAVAFSKCLIQLPSKDNEGSTVTVFSPRVGSDIPVSNGPNIAPMVVSPNERRSHSVLQFLITEYEALFVEMPTNVRYHVREGVSVIQACRLPHLIEKLVDENYNEGAFGDIIFLTHGYYTTSAGLLKRLTQLFDDYNSATKNWQHRIRMRILHVLRDWVAAHFGDLALDAEFKKAMIEFTTPRLSGKGKLAKHPDEESSLRFLNNFFTFTTQEPRISMKNALTKSGILFQKRSYQLDVLRRQAHRTNRLLPAKEAPEQSTIATPDTEGSEKIAPDTLSVPVPVETDAPGSQNEETGEKKEWPRELTESDELPSPRTDASMDSLAKKTDFLSMEAKELAEQLTMIDNQLFRRIEKRELLKKKFLKPDEAVAFSQMVARFNLTGAWTVVEILRYETAQSRAQAIAQFVKIAKLCKEVNNFNGVFAIIGGLNHTAISRLKATWEKVGRKDMKRYKKLLDFISTDKNNLQYRQTLQKTKPPLVPYLGLFSKDIFNVEEIYPTFDETDPELINFEKMRMLWKLITQFFTYKEKYRGFPANSALRHYLEGVTIPSENELYELSYKLEPRVAKG